MNTPQLLPSGPAPARIMIVSEFPSEEDVRKGSPLSDYTGLEFSKMLGEAKIARSQCFVTSVLRVRPPNGQLEFFIAKSKDAVTNQHGLVRDKMCMPVVWEGVTALHREIEMVRPNVIIALGNLALWALTGKSGIMSWRGSVMECDLELALDYKPKVIPTYHPFMVMKNWPWRNIAVHDFKRAEAHSKFQHLTRPDYRFVTRPSYEVAVEHLQMLLSIVEARELKLAVDIETRQGHIACIGLAWSKLEAICFPLMCTERLEGYWTLEQEAYLMFLLFRLLTHKNIRPLGQNFLYDAQYFHRHLHYIPQNVRDTMLMQHSCFSNLQKALDFLSSMYCEDHLFWKDDGKEWDAATGEDQLWTYNCKDAVITFEVETVLDVVIQQMHLQSVEAFQQRLFPAVLRTMNRGIRANLMERARFAANLHEEISRREAWLYNTLSREVNIKSPKQMQELFYGEFGLPPVFNRKTKKITCDDEALTKLGYREPLLVPIIRKIQELRSLSVFLSTFVNAPLDTDGRIRCSFNIAGTETYRFSSSKNAFGSGLNLQNIPAGNGALESSDEWALDLPNIRRLFIPDTGNTFFDIDLSSADLRIVVWESDEGEMKAMLREGADPYTEIAKEHYHDPSITKKDYRRQIFKSFAHGTHYLGTPKGLAERLGLSVHEAEKTQAWYFSRFPRIKKWQDDLKDQVVKRRMVENIFGYRCYIFDRIEGTIFNEVAAWIPQSTVACLINRAYVKLHEEHPEIEVLLQVHDSLAGQFPTHMREQAMKTVIAAGEIPLPYDDPLTIPVGIKTSDVSWGDCS